MSKKAFVILFLTIFALSLAALPPAWDSLNRSISQQAGYLKDTPSHLQARARDTREYHVGDTKTFWRWNLSVMPPSWVQTPATCRGVGEHSYIFVANDQWNVHMTQANVDSVLVRLEENTPHDPLHGAIELDTLLFGNIPDELDNDPRLIVFYSALGSFQGTSFDGYFSAYNQVTEAQAQQMNPTGHSNECEMIYMTCYPLNPVAPIRLSVLAHELEHLIHWGADTNEESWLDEGCAELAMVAYGVPDPISGFNSNPDNNLTAWNQTTADYVKVMLFFTYLQEHYDATGMIRSLVADPLNGMASLEAQLALHHPETTVGEVLRNWGIANALDNPQPCDGLYNYFSLDLPDFSMNSLNVHPAMANQSIQPYATDYLYFNLGQGTSSFAVNVDPPVHISTLLLNEAGLCTAVLDGGVVSSLEYAELPATARVIFVLTNHNAGTATYGYSSSVGVVDLVQPAVNPELSISPNPVMGGTDCRISCKSKQAGRLEVYNAKGQLVRVYAVVKGASSIAWDGRDDRQMVCANGIYYVRLVGGREAITKRLVLIR